MRRLSFIVFLVLFGFILAWGQSPHGKGFAMDCAKCHSAETWSYNSKTTKFRHDSTLFPLVGQHTDVNCKSCHSSLDFKKADSKCVSCHTDVHQQTVGTDCARCHTPKSWIVENVTQIHEQISFPLMGVHATVNCNDCHNSETNTRFSPIGMECINCHKNDFVTSQKPNHIKKGFSQDCASCHGLTGTAWNTNKVDHAFFPLEQGHKISDCTECHKNGDYSNATPNCISCHQKDFNSSINPNHKASGLSTDCVSCHTIAPGWKPATFTNHDGSYFPIYTGKHKGTWIECKDCHSNSSDYSKFTCTTCHKNPETNVAHSSVSGYSFTDNACLACHPTGDASKTFDHNSTQFALTGAHRMLDCVSCHAGGYKGTPTQCKDCHTKDYNLAINPDHKKLNISTDCISCHTTNPGWSPATFGIHNSIYPLNGAHAAISNQCNACHKDNYNNTPNTCVACHKTDYNNTKDPDHSINQFSQDCATCHTESAWAPSTFNHDGQYFPIYRGKHKGQWSQCVDCHPVNGDLKQFTCISCHKNPETTTAHNGVAGYNYNNNACLACHPTGDVGMAFNHNNTAFPLTGAHNGPDCIACHAKGYKGTSTVCADCHKVDLDQAINPNHKLLGFSNDCSKCHSTAPGWNPASFSEHNTVYTLKGAHATIANDCAACHKGNYNNTPNTCIACHNKDYNDALDPNHVAFQFSTDCATCHTENAWNPSTFNHDNQFFPIYTGKHKGQWSQCIDCHNKSGNTREFTCITCHQNPETNTKHQGVAGYNYSSQACFACHPTGEADNIFNHNATMFPLTGAHLGAECASCHATGYKGTPTTCVNCHTTDFNQSKNPDHKSLGISTDCVSCHTTAPGWAPATFSNHESFYPIEGAHKSIANDCAACHKGNYSTTPNTCVGCHTQDYNDTKDPDHFIGKFPKDCATCHSQDNWTTTNIDHNIFYPLLGAHATIAKNCKDCHASGYNNTPNTCIGCHTKDYDAVKNPDHLAGKFPKDCSTCHSQNNWTSTSFDHNIFYPLTGAHASISNNCKACHINGYNNTPNTCVGCHTADYNGAKNPDHLAGNFPKECNACHSQVSWSPTSFNHSIFYPLTGAHAGIANNCKDCHINGYNNTPNTCVGCHQQNYNTSLNPNHNSIGISTDCASCHTTAPGWSPASMPNHNTYYAITGAHAAISTDCVACHNGDYKNTPNTCAGCHTTDYNKTVSPDHKTQQFPTDCASCHSQNAWAPSTFNHSNYYPLLGAHANIKNNCVDCHKGNYNNTPTTCVGCHSSDFNGATNPDHKNNLYNNNCTSCHSQNAWSPALFDHNPVYPLTGAHTSVSSQCASCHHGNYSNTPQTCVGCHQTDFNTSLNPKHNVLNLSTDCVTCHSTTPGWSPASFPNHNSFYVISGAHTAISNDCNACHKSNYNNTPNTCVGCHQADYNNANNPDHDVKLFPTECKDCHSQNAWTPSSFNHSNYYPLTGAHSTIANDCVACHHGNYTNTPKTCVGCHQGDYNTSLNPKHVLKGISTDCITCHTTTPSWSPALYPTHNAVYLISGAHVLLDCIDCHQGNFNTTPKTCIGCHQSDYNTATNPNHLSAQFPTDCVLCHTQSVWTPSTFHHDQMYFPIYSGKHHNAWNLCTDCHTNTSNYSVFSCITCHEHNNKSKVDNDHDEVNNYSYSSNACFACHPTGSH
ncbi:MAG: multiheme c-type cytochrome [Saprospiraceae bacterium]